jgi:hypothetical protein
VKWAVQGLRMNLEVICDLVTHCQIWVSVLVLMR